MRVIFIRHGVPEEGDWMMAHNKNDFDRPLTTQGAAEMRNVAKGLQRLVPSIDMIVASPLVRAQQTAGILAEQFLLSTIQTEELLSHEHMPTDTLQAIGRLQGEETIICVGHQPNISATISLALTGSTKSMIRVGRGGTCGINFRDGCRPGGGELLFHLPRRVF